MNHKPTTLQELIDGASVSTVHAIKQVCGDNVAQIVATLEVMAALNSKKPLDISPGNRNWLHYGFVSLFCDRSGAVEWEQLEAFVKAKRNKTK